MALPPANTLALQTHVVTFDRQAKIVQIRQSWDQGSLLKQVEVIGRAGQNWPIRNSKDQITLIAKCAKGDVAAPAPAEPLPTRARGSSTNAMRDPHASLDFASRPEDDEIPGIISPYAGARPQQRSFTEILGDEPEPSSPSQGRDRSRAPSNAGAVISPYAGARPQQRSFTEILGDEPEPSSPSQGRDRSRSPIKAGAVISPYAGTRPQQRSFTEILGDEPEEPASPSKGRERSQSPSKAVAPKAGSKHFQPMRLFDVDEQGVAANTHEQRMAADRVVRPNPAKYQHFQLDQGAEDHDAPTPKATAPKFKAADGQGKHGLNWSFDDFVTPQKPTASRGLHRARDARHWGADNDVLENTPAPNAAVPKPRRDAEAHFELIDDGPKREDTRNPGLPRGTLQNEGMHLYDNRLHTEDGTVPSPGPPPLGNITNVKDRRKDFDAHFDMTDQSPHHADADQPAKPVAEDRKKAVRMMESNWSSYDASPVSRKENSDPNEGAVPGRGIVIAGDGMGGKKGTGHGWLHGEGEPLPPAATKGVRGPAARPDNFWDF